MRKEALKRPYDLPIHHLPDCFLGAVLAVARGGGGGGRSSSSSISSEDSGSTFGAANTKSVQGRCALCSSKLGPQEKSLADLSTKTNVGAKSVESSS